VRRAALFWLAQKGGKESFEQRLPARLTMILTRSEKEGGWFALSQMPKEDGGCRNLIQGWRKRIEIPEVRKQAMFLAGAIE